MPKHYIGKKGKARAKALKQHKSAMKKKKKKKGY
jgi:hypothetical protein